MDVKVLNKKESGRIVDAINSQFGSALENDRVFFLNKDDLYTANRECFEGVQPSWRINSLGLYLGEYRNEQFRPSIEGSQLIGPIATKNTMELDEDQLAMWLRGEVFEVETQESGFLIIKHGKDFFGSGKIKNNRMLNFVPKERRINTVA